ncbi:rRNA maturation RNase YbeY [bacterium]|nr:rRNA maturation RNase YbeY [bacterium]
MIDSDLIEVYRTNGEVGTSVEKQLKDIVIIVLEGEECDLSFLSIILSDDDLLQQLNREYLGIDEPTDVLSFDLSERDDLKIEGEIYISLDRVNVQAVNHKVTQETELIRLVIHGMLHLCGMDHNDDVSLKTIIEHGENYISRFYQRGSVGL